MSDNVSDKSHVVERFLQSLVEEMAIPESRYEQAAASYHSLGKWFYRDGSVVRHLDPTVYAQGSFRLGTAIRPINDAEDYDVDSVCELKKLSKDQLSQHELKQLLGKEIKTYHDAKGMTKPVREGSRCWILDYADGAQFHMDVLPAVPNGAERRLLLEQARVDAKWSDTAVAITDRKSPSYMVRTPVWLSSNPKGYAKWFASRMTVELNRRKQLLVESLRKRGVTASVEELPEYKVRTPLQSAVMLLKRHRDHMFANDLELKPISIIITTLAGHAYDQEETIAGALSSILAKMDQYVHGDRSKFVVPNPTDPLENFADGWHKDPRKADAFYRWLKEAREVFGRVAQAPTLKVMNEAVYARMGASLTDRAVRKLSPPSGRGLLRAASAAPVTAASAPTFGNSPRVPTTPKGFA
jgi:hypothetical protein